MSVEDSAPPVPAGPPVGLVRRDEPSQRGGMTTAGVLRRWGWLILLTVLLGTLASVLAVRFWLEPGAQGQLPFDANAIAAAGSGLALLLGIALAFLAERRSWGGIRSAHDVQAILNLETLAFIPALVGRRRKEPPHRYLRRNLHSPYARSVWGVFNALGRGVPGGGARVVLVTSSLPGEGKTTFAVSLATAAVHAGRRALLIDLDLRRPSVQRELGGSFTTGIIDYLTSERPLDEVVQHDAESGLDFLPVETQTTYPTELVESERMRVLMAAARTAYDYVVIDTAPVAAIVDTRLAAPLADRVVFVVRWGKALPSAARDSLRLLRGVGVEPAGAVITQIDPREPLARRSALLRHEPLGQDRP